MSGYPGGHAGFLAVALATHAIVGYALGAALFDRGTAGLIGGVVADADLLVPDGWGFPFAHRSATHSAIALAVAAGVAAALATRSRRATAGGMAAGYASQLLVDATTPMGIPLLYPLSETFIRLDVGISGHAVPATVALWIVSVGLLWAFQVRDSAVPIPDSVRP